jgi:diguanylate cyclase (GGDEF)-like protein
MDVEVTAAAKRPQRVPGRGVTTVQIVVLVAAAVALVVTSNTDTWQIPELLAIAGFAATSDLMAVVSGSTRVRVSGSFLGIILTAVLLGGGPAALVGVTAISIGWLRSREAGDQLRNNLATFAWFPLLVGLAFYECVRLTGARPSHVDFYLLVFAVFVLGLLLNFLFVATYGCYRNGSSMPQTVRGALVPVLPAELFSALLTTAAAYLAFRVGTTGIALFGLVFVIFQYLVGELLKSKQRSEELQRIATTDDLTGLANRERFREVMEERIIAARDAGGAFAVMLMDLDRFKEVNDTLGHHYGDVLLRDLGPRLVEAIGPAGVVARLGGDEFGVLPPPGVHDPAWIEQIATGLTHCVSAPFVVDELSLEVGASIGIARFPDDGDDSHALLRCADIAMYAAKEAQCDFKLYAANQNQHSVRRLSVLSDIRHALSSDEIVVHFQPIVELDNLAVTGAEGLVRWQHPELGLIPPAAFVQTVEQTGLIGPLTRHVLERSIAECESWRKAGYALSVAVNLSVRNLVDRDLPREIERLLATYSLPADALQLEITESMIMSDPERAIATVTRLSDLGVRMSVDDFGTGYSSLANLRRLPIDELKIDRSFVAPMLHDESDLIIVRSTINLGHDLGLRIIAEGVEDSATLNQLALLGCDLAQGYHLSRPMPADAFVDWLRTANTDRGAAGARGPAAAASIAPVPLAVLPTRDEPPTEAAGAAAV